MHNHCTLVVQWVSTWNTYYQEEVCKFKDIVLNYNHCVVIVIFRSRFKCTKGWLIYFWHNFGCLDKGKRMSHEKNTLFAIQDLNNKGELRTSQPENCLRPSPASPLFMLMTSAAASHWLYLWSLLSLFMTLTPFVIETPFWYGLATGLKILTNLGYTLEYPTHGNLSTTLMLN